MEIEATLIVISPEPQKVLEKVSRLDRIPRLLGGGAVYRIKDLGERHIHDVYLDTPNRSLGKRKWALRLRRIDGTPHITLKGPSSTTSAGQEREEEEQPWSQEALHLVFDQLRSEGIDLGDGRQLPRQAGPEDVLREFGLVVVQNRETQRQVMSLVDRHQAERAELALDEVVYHFDGIDVQIHEVEIEAKGASRRLGRDAVVATTRYLRWRWWPRLRPWSHGKLATGMAIRALLEEVSVGEVLQTNQALRISVFRRLRKELESDHDWEGSE